jgi:phytoene dehydrogenase-like protein
MKYDTVVVGGGIAGLTAAAYLVKAGKSVVLFEKQAATGGLVQTFQREGVCFDTGLRSIENSGIVFPMLKQLGIEIEFKKTIVSIGIADRVMKVIDKQSIAEYEDFLNSHYPGSEKDISVIIKEIKKIMGYMDVLYGIDNPALMDIAKNKKYLFTELLPWLFRFLFTMRRINRLYGPVEEYLRRLTSNQSLIDIIAQHFFKHTPTSFALSYFSLYLDYHYPKGGTSAVVDRLAEFIKEGGGVIHTGVSIENLQPEQKFVTDSKGNRTEYSSLIWACDLKQLYNVIPVQDLTDKTLMGNIEKKRAELQPLRGGDSVFTVYIIVNERSEYFSGICTGHFFYTPDRRGLSTVRGDVVEELLDSSDRSTDSGLKERVKQYLREYFELNTFEIAIPCLRDPDMAPEGKVGLEVSLFLDYFLDKKIEEYGWTGEMREFMENLAIEILDERIFPGLREKVADRFSSSPLTIERLTGNTHGAITGWAFTNPFVPAVNQMLKVNDSVRTILPSVYQAGQWTYSPSGFPMSIVTGKLASDRVLRSKS